MNKEKKCQGKFANHMGLECAQRLFGNWARIGARRYGQEIEEVTAWQRTEADPPGPWVFSQSGEAQPPAKDRAVSGKAGNAV